MTGRTRSGQRSSWPPGPEYRRSSSNDYPRAGGSGGRRAARRRHPRRLTARRPPPDDYFFPAFSTSAWYFFSTSTAGPSRTFSAASTSTVFGGKQLSASHTNNFTLTLDVTPPALAVGRTTALRSHVPPPG